MDNMQVKPRRHSSLEDACAPLNEVLGKMDPELLAVLNVKYMTCCVSAHRSLAIVSNMAHNQSGNL